MADSVGAGTDARRLADLAAETFWGSSVDTLTKGLSADTAALLVKVLAAAGARLEAKAVARSAASASSYDKDSLIREVPKVALVTRRWLRMAGYGVLGVAAFRLLVPVQHCARRAPSGWTMPQLTARWLPWDASCPSGWLAEVDIVATSLQLVVLALVAAWMLRARQ